MHLGIGIWSMPLSALPLITYCLITTPPTPKISGPSLHFMYHLHFLSVQQYLSILSAKIFRKRNLGKPWMTSRSTSKVTAGRN